MKPWSLVLLAIGVVGVPLLIKKVIDISKTEQEFETILHDVDDFVSEEIA